ncbi:MAG: DUF2789 domain-containing protein [Burkholderiales bacterium]|nr:DUF2789 domain-containing protein [Burkholderiales bacterium]
MQAHVHSMSQLFAQLGLPDDPAAIASFVRHHAPLPGHLKLAEAPFWSASQSHLLAKGVADDADWAVVVDTLDTMLRH